MKTPLLSFTHVPHAVQGSMHWALTMTARPTKLGSLSTKTSSNKANSFLNLLRLYPHPHQPQGQVAKPRPIASLMHQPWWEGATANLSNLTQIRQQIKNLFHAKNLSYWFIQRDQTIKSLLARALDLKCGIIQGVFLLVCPKNEKSARFLGKSDTSNFFDGIFYVIWHIF